MAPNEEAMAIFVIVDGFLRGTGTQRRSSALESFPPSFDSIPWRLVYKPLGAQSTAYSIMRHWEAGELSFGGAGTLWCFTELQRSGENVSRKTVDEQTWSSKSGKGPKNGFPDQILVDKLVISSKAFDMLELTLKQEKPIVALCKIWRKGISAAASPQTAGPNIFSPGAPPSQLEVEDFPTHEGATEMQVDQGQLEGMEQQYMSEYIVLENSEGIPNPTGPGGFIQATGQDDDSIYQSAITFLYKERGAFNRVVLYRRDDAHQIASTAEILASALRNVLNFLGINTEPESTRQASTSNNNTQLMETASGAANLAAPAPGPETATHGQTPAPRMEDSINENYLEEWEFLNFDGGNGIGLDPDQACSKS